MIPICFLGKKVIRVCIAILATGPLLLHALALIPPLLLLIPASTKIQVDLVRQVVDRLAPQTILPLLGLLLSLPIHSRSLPNHRRHLLVLHTAARAPAKEPVIN